MQWAGFSTGMGSAFDDLEVRGQKAGKVVEGVVVDQHDDVVVAAVR